MVYSKVLEKQDQFKPRISRQKEIARRRAEINEIETKIVVELMKKKELVY